MTLIMNCTDYESLDAEGNCSIIINWIGVSHIHTELRKDVGASSIEDIWAKNHELLSQFCCEESILRIMNHS